MRAAETPISEIAELGIGISSTQPHFVQIKCSV